MKMKGMIAVAAAAAVVCAGSAFGYYQSPQTASARNYQPGPAAAQTTVASPAGPVTYHHGYRVMPDGSTQPVIAHHGYVINQNGAMEMTVQPVCGTVSTDSQNGGQAYYYCGGYGGCHR